MLVNKVKAVCIVLLAVWFVPVAFIAGIVKGGLVAWDWWYKGVKHAWVDIKSQWTGERQFFFWR